ncbi:MAG: DUF5666 domain-containing protein [Casimicrobiaceae bacterium]
MTGLLRNVAAAAAFGLLGAATAGAAPARVAGTIASIVGNALTITSDGKAEHVSVDSSTRIGVRTPADHAVLGNNAYIGVTATPQADGSLLASEVHVFAEAQRGTGEGHHPMGGPPGTTMTNATVKTVAAPPVKSSMTNATVAAASNGHGSRKLTLSYPGGAQTIVVPDSVPVVTTANGDLSALTPGAHVIVNGERGPDGTIAAARISVGANGSVPPI